MRFQILYRFPCRSVSKSSIVTLSTPGAPLLAFTCRYASQTSHLEISNDFPADFSPSMQLLPDSRPVDRTNNATDDPAPWLHPHRAQQGLQRYYEPVRRHTPDRYSIPYGFIPAWNTPSRRPQPAGTSSTRACLPTFPARAADQTHDAYMPDTARPVNGHPPGSSQGSPDSPWF